MTNGFIKDPFNYSGNKVKLMPLIHECLPQGCTTLVDLFGGSGIVGLNLADNFEKVIYNEKNKYIYSIIQTFKNRSLDFILSHIDNLIKVYNLDKFNKEGFLKLRENFNTLECQIFDSLSYGSNTFLDQASITLYVLICHSFNYFCTINKDGKYVNTSGASRSWFNPTLRQKLVDYKSKLDKVKNKLFLYNEDFKNIVEKIDDISNTFFFVDPIYIISNGSHRRNGDIVWTEKDEKDLYLLLNKLNDLGAKFVLTNQLYKGNNTNILLKEFIKNYEVIDTNQTFKGCSYQHKQEKDKEILVKNF
jgi:site-specific DNA-adenine methylase